MKKIIRNVLKSVLTVFLACLMVVGVTAVNANEIKAEDPVNVEMIFGYGITPGGASRASGVIQNQTVSNYSIKGTYDGSTISGTSGSTNRYQQYTQGSGVTKNNNAVVAVDVYYGNDFTHCTTAGDITVGNIKILTSANWNSSQVYTTRFYPEFGTNTLRDTTIINRYAGEKVVSVKGNSVKNVVASNYYVVNNPTSKDYEFYIPGLRASNSGNYTYYSNSGNENVISITLTKSDSIEEVSEVDIKVGSDTYAYSNFEGIAYLRNGSFVEETSYESGDILKYDNGTITFYEISDDITIELIAQTDETYDVTYHGCDTYGLSNPTTVTKNVGQTAPDVDPTNGASYFDYDSKHYRFVGWYDQTLETPYDFAQGLSSDVDLYAKFEEVYLINYSGINNMAISNSELTKATNSGLDVDVENCRLIAPINWFLESGVGISTYVISDFADNVDSIDVTIANNEKLVLNKENVADHLYSSGLFFGFDGKLIDEDNDGTKHETNIAKYAHSYQESTHYTFFPWRFYNVTGDIDIVYHNNYQVSLQKSNESSPYSSFAVKENETIDTSLLTEPQLEGVERRKGTAWYTDSACTQEFVFANPITSNLTLYAQITRPYTITVINGGVGSTKPMTSSQVAGIATFNDAGNVLTFSEEYHNTNGIGVSVNAPALGNGNKIAFTYKGVTSYLTSGTNPIVVSAGRYLRDNGSISSSLIASTDCLKYVHTSATTTLYSIRIYNLTDDLVITFMPDTKSTVKFFDGDTELTDLEIDNVSWNNKISAPEYTPAEIPEGKSFIGWFDGDGKRFNFDSTVLSDVTLHAAYGDNRTVTFVNANATSNEWAGRTGGVANTEDGIFTVAGDLESPEGTLESASNGVGANITLSSTDIRSITFHVDGIQDDIVFDSDKMPMNVSKTFYVGSDGTIKNQYVDPNAASPVSNFEYTDLFKIAHNADSKTVSLRFWNITSDITCTVNYKGITLTFVNGDDVQTINDIAYGTVLSEEQLPVDPEENFRGWITPTYSATGIISKCEEFDPTAPVTANARYYAQFNDVQYTVTIHHSHDGYQSAPIGEKFRNIAIPETVHDGNQDFIARIYKGFALNGNDSVNEDGLVINNRYQQQNKTDTVNSLKVKLGGGSEVTIPVNGAAATRYFVKDCEGNFVVRENPIVSGTPEEIDTVLAKIACDGTYGISFRIYDMECNIDLFVDYIKGSVTEVQTGMTNENNSTLSLNYQISLPENVEKSDCIVVSGGKTINLSDIDEDIDGNLNVNVYNLPAKNMNDTFETTVMVYDAVASLEAGEDVYKPVTNPIVMSAKKYLNGVIDSDNPNISAEVKAFAKDMLHFGSYSQLYFNNTEGGLANEGHTAPTERLSTVTADTENDLFVMEDVDDSVHFYGISLTLESETLMNTAFYFDDDIENYEVQVDGSKVEPDSSRGGKVNGKQIYYYTVREGAAAPDLDETHQFDVYHNGEIAYSVYWSPLSYANRAMYAYEGNPAKENLLNLVKMMYLYNESAENALVK